MAAGTLLSRVLGLGRDQVLAAVFTRSMTDAFFVAFTIPNVLRQLLAEGATQNAVLPVLARTKQQQGDDSARELFRALRGISLMILLGVTLAGILAAPWLVELFAGGYRKVPGQFERTVTLTRWLFPYIFFMGSAALGVAALNVHRRFVATSFAPGLLNVAFIVFALALPDWLGARGLERVLALAFGALVGGALQLVAQWPSLHAIGYLGVPQFTLTHPGVREALRRMGPVLVGTGIYYVDVVLARRFLSELPVGSQSYFSWAMRLCDFPQGIFVMALQTATLPTLAALVGRRDHDELEKTFSFGLRLALFVGLPATGLFVALAHPLVVLIFQRGEFGAVSAAETSRALAAQGFGIWMVAAVRQITAVYYAVGDTRTPVVVAALDLCVFIGLALGLRGPLGHVGVSVAVTGASAVQMVLLWALLSRRLRHLRGSEILRSGLRTLCATLVAVIVAMLAARGFGDVSGAGPISRLLPGLAGLVSFALTFFGVARALRSEELSTILSAARRRAS